MSHMPQYYDLTRRWRQVQTTPRRGIETRPRCDAGLSGLGGTVLHSTSAPRPIFLVGSFWGMVMVWNSLREQRIELGKLEPKVNMMMVSSDSDSPAILNASPWRLRNGSSHKWYSDILHTTDSKISIWFIWIWKSNISLLVWHPKQQ